LKLLKQFEDTKAELNNLVAERDQQSLLEKEKTSEQQSQLEQKVQEQNEKITELMTTIEANDKNQVKAINELQAINEKLEKENLILQQQLEEQVNSKCTQKHATFTKLAHRNQMLKRLYKKSMITSRRINSL
jgi:capsule polysaccharide export protein KpsE/RkpR